MKNGKNYSQTRTPMTLEEIKKRHILKTLKKCNYNRRETAKKLGISIRGLRNILKKYGVKRELGYGAMSVVTSKHRDKWSNRSFL